jgi:hypothetical protein
MSPLKEEIEQLLRSRVQGTALGLMGWVEDAEGVKRGANRLSPRRMDEETSNLIFAMLEGQRLAILRLVEAIENGKTE